VVVLTGEELPNLQEAAIARGAYDFLHKSQLNRATLGRVVRLAAMQANTFRSLRDSEDQYRRLAESSPDAILIMVANPLDTMTWVARNVTGWPRERVFGMAGVLDTARLRTFIAMELGCSVKDVNAFVLGGHGDEMVPVVRYASVGGIPVERLLPKERIDGIVKRTRGAGGEIVKLLGFSAYFSPAAAVADMVQAVLLDEKRVVPCSAYLEGEYGVNGLYVGVPAQLGAKGVEKIWQIQLTADESAALQKSAAAVKELVGVLKI